MHLLALALILCLSSCSHAPVCKQPVHNMLWDGGSPEQMMQRV